MELREFVKETIIQITDGVREGHKYVESNDYGSGISDSHYSDIDFDVAVGTIEEVMKSSECLVNLGVIRANEIPLKKNPCTTAEKQCSRY